MNPGAAHGAWKAMCGIRFFSLKCALLGKAKKFKKIEKKACIFKTTVVLYMSRKDTAINVVGVDDNEGPPVPIPNTEVKLVGAEDTWLVTARDNRKTPTQTFLNSSAGRACDC